MRARCWARQGPGARGAPAAHTDETRGLLDAARLATLPAGATVINVGRGAAIDDAALLAALDAGRIETAILDVFQTEPLPPGHRYWRHERVWVYPHVAAETDARSAALHGRRHGAAVFTGARLPASIPAGLSCREARDNDRCGPMHAGVRNGARSVRACSCCTRRSHPPTHRLRRPAGVRARSSALSTNVTLCGDRAAWRMTRVACIATASSQSLRRRKPCTPSVCCKWLPFTWSPASCWGSGWGSARITCWPPCTRT
jgi:hypothetical protein